MVEKSGNYRKSYLKQFTDPAIHKKEHLVMQRLLQYIPCPTRALPYNIQQQTNKPTKKKAKYSKQLIVMHTVFRQTHAHHTYITGTTRHPRSYLDEEMIQGPG